MDERNFNYLKIYVNYIKPAFVASATEDTLFINTSGHQLAKGTIGRRVPEFFKKAGIHSDVRVTPTRVRKFYETAADMYLDTTQQQLVADHLKHKLSIAKQNYVSKLNPTKASRAHRVLGRGIASIYAQTPVHTADI